MDIHFTTSMLTSSSCRAAWLGWVTNPFGQPTNNQRNACSFACAENAKQATSWHSFAFASVPHTSFAFAYRCGCFFKRSHHFTCRIYILFLFRCKPSLKMRPHLHANTNEAGRGEVFANICIDCNTRQNVVVCRANEWFSLKYRLQVDSVRSASDRIEAVFLSPVTRLHCCACLASAWLGRVFVLMWTGLQIPEVVRRLPSFTFEGVAYTTKYACFRPILGSFSCEFRVFHRRSLHACMCTPRTGLKSSVSGVNSDRRSYEFYYYGMEVRIIEVAIRNGHVGTFT